MIGHLRANLKMGLDLPMEIQGARLEPIRLASGPGQLLCRSRGFLTGMSRRHFQGWRQSSVTGRSGLWHVWDRVSGKAAESGAEPSLACNFKEAVRAQLQDQSHMHVVGAVNPYGV